MPTCTLANVNSDVRGILSDTQIAGGEIFTDTYLQPHFAEPYRSMFGKLLGSSKRIQRVIGVVLPAQTSVLIPSTYNITDFAEPEMVEERPAPTGIPILSTDTSTPIIAVTVLPHGLGANGTVVEGIVSGVASTSAPWGNWFVTVTGPSTFTLNGSASDAVAGTGGNFYPENNLGWVEVSPTDLTAAGLDGTPQSSLGVYLWINEMLRFRGASNPVELRITYYASGNPPTNVNTVIGLDNARDFLAYATASNAAGSKGWRVEYERLRNKAYGDPSHPEELSLLDLFWMGQVLASQRGPARRQSPFRDKRSKFGTFLLG